MLRHCEKIIDVSALQHNFQQVKQLAPQSKMVAMIKANAYGHGDILAANAFAEADAFGVAHLGEALALRKAGVKNEIIIFSGQLNAEQLQQAQKNQLTVVVHDFYQIALLKNLKLPISAWIKIDTGMHRLGFAPADAERAMHELQQIPHLKQPIVAITHFASADDVNNELTKQQLQLFHQTVDAWHCPTSLANSAAILAHPESHADWVRPGIMLYGISPFTDKTGKAFNLKTAMTVRAPIIAVHQFHKNDGIGYGSTYRCPENMPVGVIGIGYGDGYLRHAPTGTPVLINNQITPLVGRVSMDMITVDLRNSPQTKVGDIATLWGNDLPPEVIAKSASTIAYELVCAIK